MEAYSAAKLNILNYQNPDDFAVLGREDQAAWALRNIVKGNLFSFGLQTLENGQNGTYIQDDLIWLKNVGGESQIMPVDEVTLRGDHNLLNVLAACAIAAAAGLPIEAIRAGVNAFKGIPHRLEFVRQWGGADWYNDSIATAPERSIAAIKSFDQPIILLAGGRDKDLPWNDFAKWVAKKVAHIILFGESADIILRALISEKGDYTLTICGDLTEAIKVSTHLISPGDVVLLSPGGTSYDAFFDFAERGNKFIELVNEL